MRIWSVFVSMCFFKSTLVGKRSQSPVNLWPPWIHSGVEQLEGPNLAFWLAENPSGSAALCTSHLEAEIAPMVCMLAPKVQNIGQGGWWKRAGQRRCHSVCVFATKCLLEECPVHHMLPMSVDFQSAQLMWMQWSPRGKKLKTDSAGLGISHKCVCTNWIGHQNPRKKQALCSSGACTSGSYSRKSCDQNMTFCSTSHRAKPSTIYAWAIAWGWKRKGVSSWLSSKLQLHDQSMSHSPPVVIFDAKALQNSNIQTIYAEQSDVKSLNSLSSHNSAAWHFVNVCFVARKFDHFMSYLHLSLHRKPSQISFLLSVFLPVILVFSKRNSFQTLPTVWLWNVSPLSHTCFKNMLLICNNRSFPHSTSPCPEWNLQVYCRTAMFAAVGSHQIKLAFLWMSASMLEANKDVLSQSVTSNTPSLALAFSRSRKKMTSKRNMYHC